jgi:hypothetical protein
LSSSSPASFSTMMGSLTSSCFTLLSDGPLRPVEPAMSITLSVIFSYHTQHSDSLLLVQFGSLTHPGHLYLCQCPFDLVSESFPSLGTDVILNIQCGSTHLFPVRSTDVTVREPESPDQNVATSHHKTVSTHQWNSRNYRIIPESTELSDVDSGITS